MTKILLKALFLLLCFYCKHNCPAFVNSAPSNSLEKNVSLFDKFMFTKAFYHVRLQVFIKTCVNITFIKYFFEKGAFVYKRYFISLEICQLN